MVGYAKLVYDPAWAIAEKETLAEKSRTSRSRDLPCRGQKSRRGFWKAPVQSVVEAQSPDPHNLRYQAHANSKAHWIPKECIVMGAFCVRWRSRRPGCASMAAVRAAFKDRMVLDSGREADLLCAFDLEFDRKQMVGIRVRREFSNDHHEI